MADGKIQATGDGRERQYTITLIIHGQINYFDPNALARTRRLRGSGARKILIPIYVCKPQGAFIEPISRPNLSRVRTAYYHYFLKACTPDVLGVTFAPLIGLNCLTVQNIVFKKT